MTNYFHALLEVLIQHVLVKPLNLLHRCVTGTIGFHRSSQFQLFHLIQQLAILFIYKFLIYEYTKDKQDFLMLKKTRQLGQCTTDQSTCRESQN